MTTSIPPQPPADDDDQPTPSQLEMTAYDVLMKLATQPDKIHYAASMALAFRMLIPHVVAVWDVASILRALTPIAARPGCRSEISDAARALLAAVEVDD